MSLRHQSFQQLHVLRKRAAQRLLVDQILLSDRPITQGSYLFDQPSLPTNDRANPAVSPRSPEGQRRQVRARVADVHA
jgi:hypothetical protein